MIYSPDSRLKTIVGPIQIGFNSLDIGDPRWSPDGEYISFTGISQIQNTRGIFLVSTKCSANITDTCKSTELEIKDGSGIRTTDPIRGELEGWNSATWSPDGQRLIFECATGFCLLGRNGTGFKRLVTEHIGHPHWSPDGHYIAYLSSQGNKIYLLNLDTNVEINLNITADILNPTLIWITQTEATYLSALPTPLPTPTATSKLELVELCSPNPDKTHLWQVRNPNNQTIKFTLEIFDEATGAVGGSLTDKVDGAKDGVPGEYTTFMRTRLGSNTARLIVNNVVQTTVQSDASKCVQVTPTSAK